MLYITDAAIRLERERAAERSRAAEIVLLQNERTVLEPSAALSRPERAWHRSLARLHIAPRWGH